MELNKPRCARRHSGNRKAMTAARHA